jgi:hypothetical protein
MNNNQKKIYNEPCLTVQHIVTFHMLSASDGFQVHTTSESVSTSHDALTKDNDYNVWDDDWSE